MLLQDIRYGWRMMLRKPGLTLAAVLSLGLGIGATSVVFTWLKGIYLRPLPGVEAAGRLVTINAIFNKRTGFSNSALDLAYYREHNQVFEGLLAHEFGIYNISLQRTPEVISGGPVSGNYFDLLGVKAQLGRTFRPDEDQVEGRDAVAVISHSLWQRKFSLDPSVVGKTVLINQVPFTVIGIAPEQFAGVYGGLAQDIWFPMQMQSRVAADAKVTPRTNWFQIMARLKPEVTITQAQANLDVMAQQMRDGHRKGARHFGAGVYPLHKAQRGLQSGLFPFVAVLGVVVGLVLLIACLNVANLLLSRAAERAKEVSLRLALGATSGRLLRQLLTESVMLAVAGGFIGLLIAFWLGGSLTTLMPMQGMSLGLDLRTDYRVLGFVCAISLVCGIGFGFAPAWMASRTSVAGTLKEQGGGVIGGARQHLRAALVVAQIGLSLMALVGAGLFAQSLRNALAADPGFSADNAVIAQVNPKLNQYSPERGRQFYSELLRRLREAPGVRAASLTSFIPLSQSGGGNSRVYEVDGRPADPEHPISVDTDMLAPDFFATMGIPITRGREFRSAEPARAAVVNETFVKLYLAGRDPIGARIRSGRDWIEVVGVCRDFKYRRLDEEPRPHAFLPVSQEYSGEAIIVLRGDSGVMLDSLRRTVASLDPDMPVFRPMTLRENVGASFSEQRLTAILLTAFSVVAVVLAIIGLYAVMASFVGTRVREIGVRMALGADSGTILAMVMQRGVLLVAIGVAIGFVLAGLLTRVVASMLFGVGAFDPLTFTATALLLMAVGGAACWLPARRAASVDPMTALRFE